MKEKPIRLLLIEDDEDDYILTKGLLTDIPTKAYQIDWANSYTAGLHNLVKKEYDICLIDYRLGKHNGIELIQAAQKKNIRIPFVLLTGERDLEIDLQGMQAGASDYLIKGQIDAQLLARTIRYAIHQHKIESELRSAEEKYRNFFENTTEGIFQTSPAGKLLIVNPGFARICGFTSAEEMLSHTNTLVNQMYVKPNRRSEFLRVMRKKGTIANFESQIYKKDGSVIWISENARSITDESGKILYFEGTVHDITIRKRAEEQRSRLFHEQIARKESEKNRERTAKLLQIATLLSQAITPEQVADVLVTKGIKMLGGIAGSVTVMDNEEKTIEIVRAIGLPKSILKNWNFFPLEMDTPVTRAIKTKKPQFVSTIHQLLKTYADVSRENIVYKNASWISLPMIIKKEVLGTINITFETQQEFDKNLKTFLAAFAQQGAQALERANLYELEQQARAESEFARDRLNFLSESTKILTNSLEYTSTLKNVAKAIVPAFADWCTIDMVNENGDIHNLAVVHANPAKLVWARKYREKFPVIPSDAHGIANVLRSGKSEIYTEISETALAAMAKNPVQLRLLREAEFRSVMIVPIKHAKRTIGTLSFITTRESERLYTTDDLIFAEEIANRVSIAIDNAKLYQKAQEGIKVRDEFLNIASHELKTPLTSLQLQIQLLLKLATQRTSESITKEHLRKVLETSEIQVKRLNSLISNLLDVSRISNRKFDLEREPVNLSELTREIISRFDETVKESGSKINFHNGEKVVGKWDKFRLDQVATNLISNAIKYGQGKPITVTVDKAGNLAKLVVKDRGIGIGKDDEKRIFNRFERSSQAKKYGGLGLGLYIANQIVEAHGGSIMVKSQPEKGSEFIVNLPLDKRRN